MYSVYIYIYIICTIYIYIGREIDTYVTVIASS